MTTVDDLWLASFLIAEGAQLSNVCVIPYRNGRLTAVFQLENVPLAAMERYGSGDPAVKVHALRQAINKLRDLMYEELSAANYQPKRMPNGQRRCGNENRSGNHR